MMTMLRGSTRITNLENSDKKAVHALGKQTSFMKHIFQLVMEPIKRLDEHQVQIIKTLDKAVQPEIMVIKKFYTTAHYNEISIVFLELALTYLRG